MKKICIVFTIALVLVCLSFQAGADEILHVKKQVEKSTGDTTQTIPFQAKDKTSLVLDINALLFDGVAKFRILDAQGSVLVDLQGGGLVFLRGNAFTVSPGEKYTLEVDASTTYGKYEIRIFETAEPLEVLPFILSGLLMMFVAVTGVIVWKRRSKAGLRWFWIGAGIWTVGVFLKFVFAFLVNEPFLGWLAQKFPIVSADSIFPRVYYILIGGLYIGLLTGIFEIGVTLLAAFIWKSMAEKPGRAVAVGLGAGAFEAFWIGLAAFGGVIFALTGLQGSKFVLMEFARTSHITAFAFFAGPVERVIAILCHTSSRALTLLSVKTKKMSYFWWGFWLMTGLDAVAAFFYLSYKVGVINLWWIELAVLPFGLISIPIIIWCIKVWPVGERN